MWKFRFWKLYENKKASVGSPSVYLKNSYGCNCSQFVSDGLPVVWNDGHDLKGILDGEVNNTIDSNSHRVPRQDLGTTLSCKVFLDSDVKGLGSFPRARNNLKKERNKERKRRRKIKDGSMYVFAVIFRQFFMSVFWVEDTVWNNESGVLDRCELKSCVLFLPTEWRKMTFQICVVCSN